MTDPFSATLSTSTIPSDWGVKVAAALSAGETAICWLEVDLTQDLRYGKALLLLTESRFLAISALPSLPAETWERGAVAGILCRDQLGVGSVELLGGDGRLALWRFTARHATAAHRFAQRVAAALRNETLTEKDTVTVCPSCGTTLGPEDVTCENCAPVAQLPPSKSLLRVLPFARRRGVLLGLGMFFTIAATAATLIPPYLTMPLVDEVLTPLTSGNDNQKRRALELVPWYLGGLFLAAVLGWVLGWAKTWIVARLSSRIAADLRNAMYSHLQRPAGCWVGGIARR